MKIKITQNVEDALKQYGGGNLQYQLPNQKRRKVLAFLVKNLKSKSKLNLNMQKEGNNKDRNVKQ